MKTVFFRIAVLTLSSILGVGCATLESWFAEPEAPAKPTIVKYSEVPQVLVPTDRTYKRMTRERMEEESELQASAGSFWKMEGQTSYLFTQNQTRQEGDILKIKLVQPLMKQAETKVGVINDLLKELEEEKARQEAMPVENIETRGPAAEKAATERAATEKTLAEKKVADSKDKPNKEEPPDLTDISVVQSRIVETLPDGNFRVRGTQTVNIRKRPFRLHLTGVVKAEDFNDEGISSDRLIDPQLDIVGVRKTKTQSGEEESGKLDL